MTPDRLLAYFDRISEAPDAIPRLRQFILELAVRGKLVDHDPKDDPVSGLLRRIQAERERRVKKGDIKKEQPLPEVRPDEAWLDISASWCWVRLGTLTQIVMGQSPPGATYNKIGEGIPLINGPVEFTEGPFGKTVINQYTTAPTNLCEEGDLLLCVRGSTTGRTNIAGFRACIGRGVAAIRPLFADQYVRLFIWRLRASIIAMGRGIAFPSVSRQQIEQLLVPLPPLAEQHRIVAKVNELMALCDRLEAAQAQRESRRDRLAAASLQRLNQPADAPTFREHARFHLRHLPRLTTRPDHIQQLRQTILNLAVRGHLVPQDPSDEPASDLLKRIHLEKARRVTEGSLRNQNLSPLIGDGETEYELPKGWQWVRMAEVIKLWNGYAFKSADFQSQGVPVIRIGDLQHGEVIVSGAVCVPETVANTVSPEVWIPPDALLIAMSGATTGKVAFNRTGRRLLLNQRVGRIEVFLVSVDFIRFFFETIVAQNLSISFGTAIPNLSAQQINETIVPLPPLAEQHRIVAKVDELMAVCDQLEAELTTAQTENRRFLEAVLHEALAPPS